MKICWLQKNLGAFGGAESNVLDTAGALRSRGAEHFLIHREVTGLEEDRWRAAFHRTHRLAPGEDLAGLLRAARPDVVWIHNWDAGADFPALRRVGIPMARMVHDHALYCLRHYKYHPLTRKNCTRPASGACVFPCLAPLQRGRGVVPVRWADFRAKLREIADNRALDRLVVASAFMRGELEKNGFAPDKIRILPPVPSEPAGTGGENPACEPGRLLFVGQVIRGKGLDLLLRALAGWEGNWALTVAGRGSALAHCQRLAAKLGLAGRVEFFGHLEPAALSQLYQRAQIVVVPSAWQEPFGMVGVEAMRHARPVVAFAVGGIPEWLRDGETGRLVPAGDIPALRRVLQELTVDPDLARSMGERGREMAKEIFSFEAYADNVLSMLRETAALSPAAPGPTP